MARDTLGTNIWATTTRRGCPIMKSMMTTLSRDWVGSSRYATIHTLPRPRVLRGSFTKQGW
jgi:hypothetical protein